MNRLRYPASASLGLQRTSVWVGGCKMCVSLYYSSLAVHIAERDRRGNKETAISEWIRERCENVSFTRGFLALNTLVIMSDTSVKWAAPLPCNAPLKIKQKQKNNLAAHEHKFEMKTSRWTFLRWLTLLLLWALSHFLVFGLFTIWHKNTNPLGQKVNVCPTRQIYINHPIPRSESADRNANPTGMFPTTIRALKGFNKHEVACQWGLNKDILCNRILFDAAVAAAFRGRPSQVEVWKQVLTTTVHKWKQNK